MGLLIKGVGGGVISPFKVKLIGNRFNADVQSQRFWRALRVSDDVQSQKIMRALRVSNDVQSQKVWRAFRVHTGISFSA